MHFQPALNPNSLLVVNLFGGPGTGKSTYATRLFSELKMHGVNCEYVSEYAKDLVWDDDLAKLGDQLYVTAKQNRKLMRLIGKVDVAVSDAPLLLGLHYAPPEYLGNVYAALVRNLFADYNNLNIFLTRPPGKVYQPHGRCETEDEARQIDEALLQVLKRGEHPFHVLPATWDSLPAALQMIEDARARLGKAA